MVKPPLTRELDMDNVCEDDDNEEDDSANSKVNDVEANKN